MHKRFGQTNENSEKTRSKGISNSKRELRIEGAKRSFCQSPRDKKNISFNFLQFQRHYMNF